MKAGRCSTCDQPTWHTAIDPNGGRAVLLWPFPTSIYAGIRHGGLDSRNQPTQSSIAVGIGFCQLCAPVVGQINLNVDVPNAIEVVELESAKSRYAFWYTPGFGEWMRAHARDYLKMDDVAITKLMKQWEEDRA
jgi:hypothetical protein